MRSYSAGAVATIALWKSTRRRLWIHLQEVGFAEGEDGGGQYGQQFDGVVAEDAVPQQQDLLAGQVAGEGAYEPLERQPQRLHADRPASQ